MNPQTLLNKPQTSPAIVARISKIGNLAETSDKVRKSSTSLRKVFEKGTYQKRTQLSILKRYKKRLDIIQKQNDKNFFKKKKVKIKLPEIKKYTGNFLTPGSANDPLKAIGALAAFNTAKKVANKDYLGAIGPALVAAGIFLGPSLLRGGVNAMRRGGGETAIPGVSGATSGSFWGTPYSQTRAGQSYAGMQAQRNLPGWAQRAVGGSASRFAASNERIIQGTANVGDRLRVGTRGMGMQGVGGVAENLATTKPRISPRFGLLNAALFGLDFAGRKSEGQTNLQATVGAGAGVGGALIGAAIGTALFPGVGTLAGFLIGAAFSTGGALIATKIADTLTGADKLGEQTEEQKKAVEEKKKQEQGGLTFGKTLNRYDKAITKFEKFSKEFKFYGDNRASKNYREGQETLPPPPPTNQNVIADTQVVQDAVDFRSQFPLGRGTPQSSIEPYELQMRENEMLHRAGIGNDPQTDRVHVDNSAHYSNRAIDIPVNSKELGDRVAQFWRSRGYHVIWWSDPDHRTHVHVQWNEGSSQAGPPTGNPNVFNLELHHPGANERQRSGLIENMLVGPQGNVVTQAFKSSFDSYKRGFRDLGGPKRGLNLLEMANELGVDANAQKIVDIMKRHPNYQFNLFAGHTDVPTGDPGGSGAEGEQVFVTKVANRVMQLAAAAGLRNVKYYPATARVGANDPRANWNVAQRLWQAGQRSGRQPLTPQQVASSLRQAPPRTIGPRPQQSITIPVPIQQPQQQVVSSGGGGGMMMMPGPSQQQLLNSFYRRVLLNTV